MDRQICKICKYHSLKLNILHLKYGGEILGPGFRSAVIEHFWHLENGQLKLLITINNVSYLY
jgi:hypothetical protein